MPFPILSSLIALPIAGDPSTAERGYELGLVNRVTEKGGALDSALELAATIAANGPLALAGSKRILRESLDWAQSEAFERQAPIWQPIFASEDAREGATAFAEKRPPVWQGK